MTTARAEHEISHGQWLAANDPESVWGWGTPAGALRAQRRGRLLAEAARLGPGTRALEIGCGGGMFTEMLSATGTSILAVDISPELIELARRRQLPPGRVEFRCMRFEDGDFHEAFDAVVGSSVLHHLEVAPSLRLIHAALRPGGRLAFAEPNLLNPQVWAERRFRHLPRFQYVSPDETAFVRWDLQRLLREVGFDEIVVTPHDWLHPATPRPLLGLVRGLGSVAENVPLLREFAGSLIISARKPGGAPAGTTSLSSRPSAWGGGPSAEDCRRRERPGAAA